VQQIDLAGDINYPLYFSNSSQRLKFRLNLYELKEGRQIKPKTFMSMVSNLLYERR
jgi:20S proteasome alpha/beta subunit